MAVLRSGRGDGAWVTPPAALVPALPAPATALIVPASLLLAVLSGAAQADDPAELAAAALAPLCALPGVRAGAVVCAESERSHPVVLASCGYDCDAFGPGLVLPRDAGLPVTEAVRTGRSVVAGGRGQGPSWVAVHLPGPGSGSSALLLSLDGPVPGQTSLAVLERLGGLLAPVLARAERAARARADLTVLEEGLAPPSTAAPGLAVRCRPFTGRLTGDVVELVYDGPVRWLLLADVSGRGHSAAVAATRLRSAFRAAAPGSGAPTQVLAALDRALAGGEEEFATALVLRVAQGRVVVASAGHAAPLVRTGQGVSTLPVVPAAPLGLRVDGPWAHAGDLEAVLPPGALLVACTDGLTDRHGEVDLAGLLARLPADRGPHGVAEALLAGCEAAGAAEDDATLLVLEPGSR